MNQNILQTLFLDNPEIPGEIAKFCENMPGYARAEQEYRQAIQELEDLIGFKRYSQFENAMTSHLSYEVRAYYLFGLGLRREISAGMAG